ncbi:transglutaminase domain-containing protein [Candidatus Woesearchaeota archaeon]|nr:transglutaminase domain-containing protein [Candidatus Woesearchaeota archaeon]
MGNDLDELVEGQEPWYKGPIKYILGVFLILMIVLWLIPIYSVKLDPEPLEIPSIAEVVPSDISVEETHFNDISMAMVNGNDEVIKGVADKIVVKACGNRGRVCHAKALFYFVRDNFEYINDPTAYEYVKTAKESLVSGGGDCDDSSVLLANLLDAIGVRIRFVFIPGHVYVQAYLPDVLNRYKQDGDMVNLDPACKSCDFGEISWKSAGKETRVVG